MKKVFILLLSLFLISGCNSNGTLTNSTLYTTMYPFEYAAKYIYGDYSNIQSIYPSGADIATYKLTDKNKDIYSKGDIFIYASASDDEVSLTRDFLNLNENLKIIDATKSVSYVSGIEELWLDPLNYLMIIRNIKNTLMDYESNAYNQKNIEEKFDELYEKVTMIDADLTLMVEKATRTSLLASDDAFNFLTRHGINVISIDPDNEDTTKNYSEAKKLIASGDIKYIYVMKGKEIPENVEAFITENNLEKVEINPLYTISDEDKKNNIDYLTIMNENVEKYKTELSR